MRDTTDVSLWVPVHEVDFNERAHYVDNRVKEGLEGFRAPTLEQRQILKD